jgi:hypothetical protein
MTDRDYFTNPLASDYHISHRSCRGSGKGLRPPLTGVSPCLPLKAQIAGPASTTAAQEASLASAISLKQSYSQAYHAHLTQRMCTQELVWCFCGHGELLPIVKCPNADLNGSCWTVVHGNHDFVVDLKCSYCKSGLPGNLAAAVRPQGDLAKAIERNAEPQQETPVSLQKEYKETKAPGIQQEMTAILPEDCMELSDQSLQTAGEVPWELDDVLKTGWSELCLDPDLWQYS